jgi:pimeloyl-ACP methyl ester carboxylesterase
LAENAHFLVHDTTLIEDMRHSPPITDDQLRGVTCPVLALYGAGSELIEQGRKIAALAPRAELRLLDGASHLVLFEATAQLRDEIRSWLRARG